MSSSFESAGGVRTVAWEDGEPWGGLAEVRHYPTAADADAGTNLARTVSYGFDPSGNVTETADTDFDPVDPAIETTVYDELDRPELVTVHYVPGGDRTLESSYDRYGNRKGLVFTDGADVLNHGWTYDKLNRLKEAQLASPSPLEFTYFANDDLETITHGNGVVTEYAYWPEGPVQSITVESPSEQLLKLTYTVNKVLNVTAMNEQHAASGPVHGYGYGFDALDRVTSATYPTALGLPASESFAYDPAGNREDPSNSAAYDYDANNRITASPGKVWVYDGDGNPVSVNAGTGTQETFAHDAQNRMRGYTNTATSATASYLSDPFARRMKKSVNATATWFLWDGEQLLAQFDGSGDRDRRYAYAGGFAPAEQAVADGSGEDVQTVHADHLDTPRGLSGGSADAVWRAAYRVFGSTTPEEDPDSDLATVTFAVRFPGQLADPESSLHYNRFRYYRSATGRYETADPLGQYVVLSPTPVRLPSRFSRSRGTAFPLGSNAFSYAASRPLDTIDYDGLRLYFIGPRGAVIVGAGGEVGFGFYVGTHEGGQSNQGWFGGSFDAGLYGVAGVGGGVEVGVGVEAGRLDSLSGPAANMNFGLGPVSASTVLDLRPCNLGTNPSFPEFAGRALGPAFEGEGSLGLGIGLPGGASFTGTYGVTTTDAIRAAWRWVTGLF